MVSCPPTTHGGTSMSFRQRFWTIACGGMGLAFALLGITSIATAQEQATTLQMVQQNGSGISGTATFTPAGGGLRVDIQVSGAGAGPQPAHIHPGSCGQLDPTPQFTLASVANGQSTTNIQTTMQTLTSSPHAIHIHKSADEISVYVACAEIMPSALPRTGAASDSLTGVGAALLGAGLLGTGVVLRRVGRRA